ncbi:MAG: cytidylate kinase-like family protein [Ruminococcus flavefaciens]|nr:cytidylate kinase-like family protein [Ruminococcus flavefaciens]MCM1361854.1 cytidylate kinase-like family protein [Clostridiales bacterium]MCM1434781.1 cytidylate kinase-like family protein [Ruminococcus flavefaciens]
MKIITISREFGSGGRELGKRLAEKHGIPCYDREIIDMVAERQSLDKNYVEHISEKDIHMFYPMTIAHRFMMPNLAAQQPLMVAVAQHKLIKQLAERGDCIIVGRNADVICKEMNPMKIFVYADNYSKIERCKSRAKENEYLTDKEILRNMKQIDKDRAAYHNMCTDEEWGNKNSYHLCINTSGMEIKALIPSVSEYVRIWFDKE